MSKNIDEKDFLPSTDGVTSPVGVAFGPGDRFAVDMVMPTATFERLEKLAADTNQGLDGVFRKAILLYEASTDAIRKGKAVGIADKRESLETEFVGL